MFIKYVQLILCFLAEENIIHIRIYVTFFISVYSVFLNNKNNKCEQITKEFLVGSGARMILRFHFLSACPLRTRNIYLKQGTKKKKNICNLTVPYWSFTFCTKINSCRDT